MSRSSPPPSTIAARAAHNNNGDRTEARPAADRPPTRRRKFNHHFAAFMRWAHIYLSMFALAAVLFFSVTGITLNHPDWFYGEAESRREAKGAMSARWLNLDAPRAAVGDEDDETRKVAKLEVVEHLRNAHHIRGAVSEFRADDRECTVTFKGPGYAADAYIDRASGEYTLTETYHGFVAVINDLHKGRDTGKAWSVVIDVSAALMTLISLTGLVLLFYIKRRRVPGLLIALVGTAAVVAIVVWLVP